MGKRELVDFAYFVFQMIVVWLFLVVPWVCLQFVVAVFPDHINYKLQKMAYLEAVSTLCHSGHPRYGGGRCSLPQDNHHKEGLLD